MANTQNRVAAAEAKLAAVRELPEKWRGFGGQSMNACADDIRAIVDGTPGEGEKQ